MVVNDGMHTSISCVTLQLAPLDRKWSQVTVNGKLDEMREMLESERGLLNRRVSSIETFISPSILVVSVCEQRSCRV